MRLFAIFFLFILCSPTQAFTFGTTFRESEPEFLKVDQAFQLSISAPEAGLIKAKWVIADGYYLYQHRFALSGPQADKLHFAPFPKGDKKTDDYFGETTIYRQTLTLPIYYDITLPEGTEVKATLTYQGCADRGLCYPPQKVPVSFTIPHLAKSALNDQTKEQNTGISKQDTPISQASYIEQLIQSQSLWSTALALFGFGLLLSLTPCVLPMLPIVSAIVVGTQKSKSRAFYYSAVYVFAMAITYASIGALAGLFGTQLNLQASLQSPILLMASSLVFVALALAMFGLYELRLPASWQTRLQVTSSNSHSILKTTLTTALAGILATLIISPCVSAPVAGVILYITSQGNTAYGAFMLFIMALGMGVPLLLMGLFGPRILPKSGAWMEDIKVLMGFGLLAVAIWLTSRWLNQGEDLFLWAGLGLGVGGYFLHRIKNTASHPIRWFFFLLFTCMGILEMIGAMSGGRNPLTPLRYAVTSTQKDTHTPLYSASITSLDDLQTIIASNRDKPIVLDLYADWCISCKALEKMFYSPDIHPLISQVNLIRVDVTKNSLENQQFMEHFSLFGPPSLVFLSAQGEEKTPLTLVGEPSKDMLIDRLTRILD